MIGDDELKICIYSIDVCKIYSKIYKYSYILISNKI